MILPEIQEICYLPENEQTPQKIFCLKNLTFIHGMLLDINIRPKLKSLTERKLFGTYYHAITCHAPTQYRILSGRAANTEKEEAFFTDIKTDTKLTSNYHPENLVTNAIVRAQARKSFSSSGKLLRKESYIHNYYTPLQKTQKNTLIPFQWIRTFPHQYQQLLERLSDFLLDGENWWSETNEGVEFADVTPVQPSKTSAFVQQFHFRSNTVKTVQTYIQDCWGKCMTLESIKILAYQIKTFKITGDSDILKLHDLKHFENLLQNKYQQKTKICLNTPVTSSVTVTLRI